MYTQQECETQVRCPDCEKIMYELKGAISPIYVCSHCGASIDQETIQKEYDLKQENNNGEKSSLLKNLFTKQFMRKYTNFSSISEFCNECNLFKGSIEEVSKESISQLPERRINRFVKKHTCFMTWDQMFQKAVECYLKM